ncbi:orotidine 5'-phosphate decarboxylase [Methanocella paludicola SANAE]|uniref:Orotidine 5'-phosphate decarboxylase n=1 Tax=Methanocella paludicola (strain DSM 17711 / JCM 13418 / NBRC 101707 / SANAE) TaxID=304371 RepID=D1YYP3_METPS|nr:orotidine-5'-phosphate decarboxylase [Methanocella paludicola]BAI61565.1 orotidine 5'-phosphate decarboxylase [Methanocella paludicola SANAE]
MTLTPKSRLIIALDVTDRTEALSIAEKLGGAVDAIKVNYPLVLVCGLGIIKDIKKYANVIADFKVADIPNTNSLICRETFEAGADAIICQGFVGKDSVKACVDVANKYGREVYVVTEMSHPGALDFLQPHAFELVDLAFRAGASGIIAPATRPERLVDIRCRAGDMKILSPGVGAQGGDARKAIDAGADFVIVGRSIYNAEDPYAAAVNFIEQLRR